MKNLTKQIESFNERLINALGLQKDYDSLVFHKNNLNRCLRNEIIKIKKEKDASKKDTGFFNNLLGKTQKKKSDDTHWNEILCQCVKNKNIPKQWSSDKMAMPQQLAESVQILTGKQFPQYYGVVKGPFLQNLFLRTKQNLDHCLEKQSVNDLKFLLINRQVAHKYQRNLVQQLFGRIFRKQGVISMVIMIDVDGQPTDHPIELFCYIEDIKLRQSQSITNIKNLQISEEKNIKMQLKIQDKIFYVDDQNILLIFLSQIIVIPLQTLVSSYFLKISEGKANFIKYFYSKKENIKQNVYLKQQPSIRNPLFYFTKYIDEHEINFTTVLNSPLFKPQTIFTYFYSCLDIMIDLIYNDYKFELQQHRSVTSLCFDLRTLSAVWNILHEIIILSEWLQETIHCIKNAFTIHDILDKFCPLFTKISKFNCKDIQQYENLMLILQVENFINSSINKVTLEKYRNIYTNVDSFNIYEENKNVIMSRAMIVQEIFMPLIRQINMLNCNIYQAVQLLHFVAKNSEANENHIGQFNDKNLWKRIYKLQNDVQISNLDLYLDIFGFKMGIDTVEINKKPFENIKNQLENEHFVEKFNQFLKILKDKYSPFYNRYLSILLQKAIKYKKYQICKILIKNQIFVSNYQAIFQNYQDLSQDVNIDSDKILLGLLQIMPQTYRRYHWEQAMRMRMKQQFKNYEKINMIEYGINFISKKVYDEFLTSRNIIKNLSRKDYMYNIQRQICKINILGIDIFVENTQYPLLRYFYKIFMQKIGFHQLLLNFTAFFNQQGHLFQFIQCIPKAINFQSAQKNYTQSDLKSWINNDYLSQSIILCLILMPGQIYLKNIITVSNSSDNKHLFMINFNNFYNKNPIHRQSDKFILKTHNILFAFDEMLNTISNNLMQKYAQLQIMELIQQIFTSCGQLVTKVNHLKSKFPNNNSKQLLGIIFEQGFIFNLTQRMFIIQREFKRCLKEGKYISHMDLLGFISRQLQQFYLLIIRSENQLILRERLLQEEIWIKPCINQNNMIHFFANISNFDEQSNRFPSHYRKLCFPGPSESLNFLFCQSKKFIAFEDKQPQFSPYSQQILQYYIKNCDWRSFTKQKKQKISLSIQNKLKQYQTVNKVSLPLRILKLQGLQILKQKKLNFSYDGLKQFILESCTINDGQFYSLLKKLKKIEKLQLKEVKGIKIITQNAFNNFEMSNLHDLIIIDCPDIISINFKCDNLQNIVIHRNQQLSLIYIKSQKLSNIDCCKCPKLKLQNIGIYILKGINVLLGQNCCDGNLHKILHLEYSIYIMRIFKYILVNFSAPEIRNVVLQTIIQIDRLDEDFLSYVSKMSSGISSLILNNNCELQHKIIWKLCDVLFNNRFLNDFRFNQLDIIDKDKINLISSYLGSQKIHNHLYKQIYFGFMNNQEITALAEVCQYLPINKHLQLHIESIEFNDETQKQLKFIKILGNKQKKLEKLTINIQYCTLQTIFYEVLFDKIQQNKLFSLNYFKTKINNTLKPEINLYYLKQISLNKCTINNLQFLQYCLNLNILEIKQTKFIQRFQNTYKIISKLNSLSTLKYISQQQCQNQINFELLIKNLKCLKSLQKLDLSNNNFNNNSITILNNFLGSNSIKQLVILSFYLTKNDDCQFNNFLKKCFLISLTISFKKNQKSSLSRFIQQMKNQSTITNLELNTEEQIDSQILTPFSQNNTLEIIQSNQLIPVWLNKKVNRNSALRSHIDPMFEPIYSVVKQDFCKIGLSLDGGGMRGLLLATQLNYLAQQVGKPPHKIFDCFGGTSIGGILALGNTGTNDGFNPACTTLEMIDFFSKYGRSIFERSPMMQLTSLFGSKYSPKNLQDLLNSYFKSCKLSDVTPQTSVIVTAVHREKKNKGIIFRSTDAILNREKDFLMKDIARATSAAPTYFPSAQIQNLTYTEKLSLLDGGIGMNNPSKLVIDEIKKMSYNSNKNENYFLVSLGTGQLTSEAIPSNAGIKDVSPILDSFTQSNNSFSETDLSENYRGHFIRISPEIDLDKKSGELDCTDQNVLKVYTDTALQASKRHFSNTIIYGKYRNQSLIEWLKQNTARKYDP